MIYQRISKMLLLGLLVLPLASCSDDNNVVNNDKLNGDSQFGKANDVFEASEWYPGGELGTDEGMSYSAETPATTNQGLSNSFNKGEDFFEHLYTITEAHVRVLAQLGFAAAVSTAILTMVMESSRTSIRQTSLATAICS